MNYLVFVFKSTVDGLELKDHGSFLNGGFFEEYLFTLSPCSFSSRMGKHLVTLGRFDAHLLRSGDCFALCFSSLSTL